MTSPVTCTQECDSSHSAIDSVQSMNSKKRSFDESIASRTKNSSARGGEEASPPSSKKKNAQKELCSSTTTSTSAKTSTSKGDDQDERRMEMNRIRAKQIRERKKKMVAGMQKQIIQLTLENNKLHTQLKIQQTEIALFRENIQQKQGQHYVPDSATYYCRESLLRSQHSHDIHTGHTLGGGGLLLDQNHGNQHFPNSGSAPVVTGLNGLGSSSLPLMQHQQQFRGMHQAFTNRTTSPLTTQDTSMSLAAGGLATSVPGRADGHDDLNSLLLRSGRAPSSIHNPISNNHNMEGVVGIGGSEHTVNGQQHLRNLFANSTSNDKYSILAKLQNEEKEARRNDIFLEGEKLF